MHEMRLLEAIFKEIPVYIDTRETTENDVVPMTGLVWRHKFTPLHTQIQARRHFKTYKP